MYLSGFQCKSPLTPMIKRVGEPLSMKRMHVEKAS